MKKIRWIGLLFSLWLLVFWGCGTIPKPKEAKGAPKIALVLGGGAARGLAHVGVIRVLEQEKIPISMIVGTSVGDVGLTDFSQKKRLMEAGMQAARQALPKIRKLIEERS